MGIHMAKPPVLVMVDGVVCGDRYSIVMERIQNRMDNIHTDVMIKCRFMINMMILRLSDGFDDLLLVGLVSKSKGLSSLASNNEHHHLGRHCRVQKESSS
jgi:hypothetical protein